MGVPRFNYVSKHECVCQWCGATFMARKPEARNCNSDACIAAAKREYGRRKRERKNAARDMSRLQGQREA